MDVPRQIDSSACGVFVLDFTERMVDCVINTTKEVIESQEMKLYMDSIVNREFFHIIR